MAVIDDILRRLFTTKVVLKKLPGGRLKTIDLNKIQTINNTINDVTNQGIYSKTNSYYNLFGFSAASGVVRNTLYSDYELMDTDALISAALDAYSDESTATDAQGEILSIETDDEKIKKVLYNLYHDILNIDFNLWYWVRSLVKYGDFFLYLKEQTGVGITEVVPIHPALMNRVENFDDSGEVMFEMQASSDTYTTYRFNKSKFFYHEIAHFRILSDTNYLPYGRSLLEGGRKDFKKLILLEDAVLIHRIMRAPDRRLFKIDVGNIPPESVDSYMESITNRMQKVPYIDPQTGDYNLNFNLMPVAHYTKIPLLDGRCISIKELSEEIKDGKENWVYSIDKENNNSIVPGKVTWCDLTKENSEIIRITLDDDSYIDFEPSHPVMLRNGDYVKAMDIKPNQSLMPFYTKISDTKGIRGYELVYNPESEKYEYTHRLVCKGLNIDDYNNTKNVVHHINFDKLNNMPNNLDCSMTYWEHIKYHSDNASKIWESKTQEERDEINKRRSETHKQNVKNGTHESWNKGKNKYTDKRVKNVSEKLKKENNPQRCIAISTALTGRKRPEHSKWMKENYIPYKRTEEHRKEISRRNSGKNNHNYGRTWDEIHKERADELREVYRLRGKENAKYLTSLWDDPEYRLNWGIHMTKENKRRWNNPEFKERVSNAMKDKFDDYLFNFMVNIIINNPTISCNKMINHMNNTKGLYKYYLDLNYGRKKPTCFKIKTIQRAYMTRGFENFKEFKNSIVNKVSGYLNHKVKTVEYISEKEDVYCMSVDKYHNFAIDSHNGESRNGIFVKNSSLEDYYIPVRGSDSGTSIESLSGLSSENALNDLEYVKNKILSYLRIPKAYLGNDEGTGSKSVLAAEDIKFARFIERIQKLVVAELEKIGYIHLYLQGFSEQSLLNFKLSLATPSLIYERQKIDLMSEKINMVNNIIDKNLFSKKYIYENIFGLTEKEWQHEQDLILEDVARTYREEQIKNEGNDPVITGKSFGTAHDLALLYMKKKEENDLIDTNNGQETDIKDLTAVDKRSDNNGRPEKFGSFERQKDPSSGIDPTGRKDLQSPLNAGHDKKISFLFKNVDLIAEKKDEIDEIINKFKFLNETNEEE